MPYKEKAVVKVYYTIGEVAKKFDISTSMLRFWESEFPHIAPKRDKKGNRKYKEEQILDIAELHQLLKQELYTIEGARRQLKIHGVI